MRGIVAWGCDTDDPCDLICQYRRVAKIEACFRTSKHDLRIRAHIAICHMAFCRAPLSPARIQEALDVLQISLLRETGGSRKFGLPSRATRYARAIYRALGLTWNTAPFVHTPPRKPHCTHATRKKTQTAQTSP